MSWLGSSVDMRLIKSMAGLTVVAVTKVRRRSVVVWCARRPRPRPRELMEEGGMVADHDRTDRI